MRRLLPFDFLILCFLAFTLKDAGSVNWNIADSDMVREVRKSSTVPMESWKKEMLEPHLRKAVRHSLHVARQNAGMTLHDAASDDCRDNVNYASFCSNYRLNGFCDSYPYGMAKHCALTCGFCKCKAKIDIVFLLDSSTSIKASGVGNYQKCLDFIKNAVNGSYVSEEFTHIGLVLFSSKIKIQFNLTQYYDIENMTKAIDDAPFLQGGTLTGKALKYVQNKVFKTTGRNGVPRVLIVLTDGRSSDSITQAAIDLHNDNITVFAIGIGRNYDIGELIEIATKPDIKYALTSEFNRLNDLYVNIRDDACRVNATLVDYPTEDTEAGNQSFAPHSPHAQNPAIAVLKSKSRIESHQPLHHHSHVKHG